MVRRRLKKKNAVAQNQPPPTFMARGGTWQPFSQASIDKIAAASIEILTRTGMSGAPPVLCDAVMAAGGKLKGERLLFSEKLIEKTIADGPCEVLLAGQIPKHDLKAGGTHVYTGTGGAAPNVLDPGTGSFRPSVLNDLHQAARLADALDHIHFFSRSLVAGDIEDCFKLDLATLAASLSGTSKHVMVQAANPEHVAALAQLCYEIAGNEASFRARPFMSLNINHAVPPLRFHAESIKVLAEAVHYGIPVHCNVFGQLGASSPVTAAGSVAQTLAETLAGLAFVHALDASAPRIAGPRPMITDLRTGGMAGGSGEQVMATTLAVQVLRFWNLPCSVIAGATDSKMADFQAGYEKALNINSAIQAGANLITQAAGTQAGLMAASFTTMVADNDMIGALLRANAIPEVTDDLMMLDAIDDVISEDSHFLGRPETYERMRSDFLYPEIADRSPIEQWQVSERLDMEKRAAKRAADILEQHWPGHLPPYLQKRLAAQFGLDRGKAS